MKQDLILRLRDLTIRHCREVILDRVGLEIPEGLICTLIGQSGSGKSILARGISSLLPENFRVTAGELHFRGRHISWRDLPRLRGSRIFYIPQNAQASLDPVKKIRRQISPGRLNSDRAGKCRPIFNDLDFSDPDRILDSYPFELSGGENQRVILSLALLQKPDLLVLDEPVSGLDPELQSTVVNLLRRIREEYRLTILLITHRLNLVSALSDLTYVIHEGRIVDRGPRREVFEKPRHPFTRQISEQLRTLPGYLT